jgi:hypothetical protein
MLSAAKLCVIMQSVVMVTVVASLLGLELNQILFLLKRDHVSLSTIQWRKEAWLASFHSLLACLANVLSP